MEILTKPHACIGCQGYGWGSDFTQVTGSGSLGVLIVAEASGAQEAAYGYPLCEKGESGSVLERVLARCGYSREQFRITNILRCKPPGNKLEGCKYEHAAIKSCRPYLDAEIAASKPRAILALGGIAARELTGYCGKRQGIQSIRGFVLPCVPYPGIPVIPTLHPAFLRRGKMSWLGILIRDLQLAIEVARNGVPPSLATNYILHPNVDDLNRFAAEAERAALLAYDLETAYSLADDEDEVLSGLDEEEDDNDNQPSKQEQIDMGAIVQIQFSIAPGTGIAVPWTPEFMPSIRRVLASGTKKLDFNGRLFDRVKLREAGVALNGEIHDLMLQWHHLQPDLPRGLQAVTSFYCPEFGPWKHLSGVDLADYGVKDVDVLQRFGPKLEADLRKAGLWKGYERHIYQLMPILDRMSERGIPVDREKQAAFATYLRGELKRLDGEIQAIVPEKLRNLHPEQGYVNEPADKTGLVQREFVVEHKKRMLCTCVDEDGLISGWTKKVTTRCGDCRGTGWLKIKTIGPIVRWVRIEPFRDSSKQVITYIRAQGHKVPTMIGDASKETTSKLFLERLAKQHKKDPLYPLLLDLRAYGKMEGTYLWTPAADSRVHAVFTNTPASGQLAARQPAVMTIPAPKGKSRKDELAVKMREYIAAPSGYVLVEVDFAGFHTSTFAFESKDEVYFRLANVIKDPHSFLTAVLLKLSTPADMLKMSDEDLLGFLGEIKAKHKALRDGQAKPAILGFALGEGANKLYELNKWDPETAAGFRSKNEAAHVVDGLRQAFPKAYAYQNDVRRLAHKLGYLANPYGFIRRFWDVFRINPKTGLAEPGEQSEATIAFNVQCDAHGYLKEVLLRLETQGLLEEFCLINIVHDSLVFCCEVAKLERCITLVQAEMQRPSEVLVDPILCPGGLVIAAEAKFGLDLAHMKGWK